MSLRFIGHRAVDMKFAPARGPTRSGPREGDLSRRTREALPYEIQALFLT